MKKVLVTAVVLAAAWSALFASADTKKSLTNADVVKMVKAELPESTIVLAIQNSAPAFDTSTDALIALKADGVSAKIIDTMLAPPAAPSPTAAVSNPQTPSSPSAAAATPAPVMSLWGSKLTRVEADRVFITAGDTRQEMKFTRPSTRTRGMIYGGVQQFAVLGGTKALLRIKDKDPEFEMILPNNVQPNGILALGRLAERKNGTREILIAGGYMSFSAGLPADRNVALSFEKAADQTQAPEGYEVYHVKPGSDLVIAEYAFMVVKGEGMAAGMFGPGASASYSFYEFAVD